MYHSGHLGYPCSISRWVRFFSFPCRFIIPFQQWPMPQMPARLVFQWLPAQYPRVSYSEVRGLLWFTPWFLEKVKNHNRFHWGDIHITPKKFMISKIRSFFIPKIQGFGFYTSPWQRKKNHFALKVARHHSSKWLKSWVRFRFNTATPAFGSMGRWSLWPPIAGCAKSCDLLIHFSKGITPPKKKLNHLDFFFNPKDATPKCF